MKPASLLFILLLYVSAFADAAAQSAPTHIYSDRVHTLQLTADGAKMLPLPVVPLDGGTVGVSFDVTDYSNGRFAYSITHCNADWSPSALSPIEYLDGFQGMVIDDYTPSSATQNPYRHYRLTIPNDDVRLKLSGNYLLRVYDEDRPDEVLFEARFALVEPLVDIAATVTAATDIDFNRAHQQVAFTLDTRTLHVANPPTDLRVYVYQNGCMAGARRRVEPQTFVGAGRIVYEHRPELIFAAGNEFRRFELTTHRFSGMRIARVRFVNPYYHAEVEPDGTRQPDGYRYDQDQNGRMLVNCIDCTDPDVEAEYNIVHFSYRPDMPLPRGDLYIDGELTNYALDDRSRMTYNPETDAYETALLLKQGHYNYRYRFVPAGADPARATTMATEGDFYQTENEYTIHVYYRPPGARYDRIVGTATVRTDRL